MDDWTQLADYAIRGDEEAFASLVRRHFGLVYAVVRRQIADAAGAEDVTQSVFVLLAQRAGTLRRRGALTSWLYSAACLKAKEHNRREAARRRRERRAGVMEDQATKQPELDWTRIAPLIDDALQSLAATDRTVILLRYFEEKQLREVGNALGLSEEAARKRASRALDRLRCWFERRGIVCTEGALGMALPTFAALAAPENLTDRTIQAALSSAASAGSLSSSTFIAAFASAKFPLIVAFLASAALPVSLGYWHRTTQKSASVSRPSPTPTSEFAFPSAEESGLLAEWEDLRARYGPNRGSMGRFYEIVSDIEDDFKRRAFRATLIAEWAAFDPEGALAYFEGKKDIRRIETVLYHWLVAEPAAAIAVMKRDASDLVSPIGGLLDEIAEIAPAELVHLVPYVKATSPLDDRVQRAFAAAARQDLPGMRRAAEAMRGAGRKEALAGIASAWAERDGAAALAWAETLEPSEDRSTALQDLLVGWAKQDPLAALDHLHLAPPGGGYDAYHGTEISARALHAAAGEDLDTVLDWLADNYKGVDLNGSHGLTDSLHRRLTTDVPATLAMISDHPARDFLKVALNRAILNDDTGYTDQIWEYLKEHDRDPEFTVDVRRHLVRAATAKNLDEALRWSNELIAEGNLEDSERETMARHLMMDIGSDFDGVESVLDQASEEWRSDFLGVAFENLSTHEGSLEIWRERLSEVSPEDRPQAAQFLAERQATVDPDATVTWADTLDVGQRSRAYQGIAKAWAEADSYECSQWIAGLEDGPHRDHAARALIGTVVESEPDSAWIWSLTIQSEKMRLQAMKDALGALRQSDEDAAVALVQEAAIPAAEKVQLQEWLDSRALATGSILEH